MLRVFSRVLGQGVRGKTLIGIACASLAAAQANDIDSADQQFLQANAEGALYQLDLAQLGAQQGTRSEITGYAQRVVVDMVRLNVAAQHFVKAHNITLTTTLLAADQRRLATFKTLRGHAFDLAFLQEDQRMDAQAFMTASQTVRVTRNANLRRLAADVISTEGTHVQIARALESTILR